MKNFCLKVASTGIILCGIPAVATVVGVSWALIGVRLIWER